MYVISSDSYQSLFLTSTPKKIVQCLETLTRVENIVTLSSFSWQDLKLIIASNYGYSVRGISIPWNFNSASLKGELELLFSTRQQGILIQSKILILMHYLKQKFEYASLTFQNEDVLQSSEKLEQLETFTRLCKQHRQYLSFRKLNVILTNGTYSLQRKFKQIFLPFNFSLEEFRQFMFQNVEQDSNQPQNKIQQ